MSEDIFDSLYDGEKLSDVIRLVADGAVSDFAGTAKALQSFVADAEILAYRLSIDLIVVEGTLLL